VSFRRSARFLTVLCVTPLTLLAVIVGQSNPASAATLCRSGKTPRYAVPIPYVNTSYGPVSFGVSVSGATVSTGFASSINGTFSPTGNTFTLNDPNRSIEGRIASSDGWVSDFCGYVAANTLYGAAVFGMQYKSSSGVIYGRWGNVNLSSQIFYPDQGTWYRSA